MPEPLDPASYRDLVRLALAEDVGTGDLTSRAVVPPSVRAGGMFLAKRVCVVAGIEVALSVFREIDPSVQVTVFKKDGALCQAGDPIARVEGPAAALLTAERTALNFLQHLSRAAGSPCSTRARRSRGFAPSPSTPSAAAAAPITGSACSTPC
jgi:nicotinate-nucleotide pyrophosphorylase (carboxylating)